MGYFVWKPEQYRGARHKAAIEFVEKHILISRFGAFLEQLMLDSAVLIIIRLDAYGERKFQMFTLFSGHHIGVLRMYSNMAF